MLVKHWRLWILIAQVTITSSLMVWLFSQVDWAQLVPLFAQLGWESIALSVVFVLISHLLNVARWRYILHQRTISYWKLLAIYGAGLFSNNFLPTGVGGDGVRVGFLSRTISLRRAVVSVGLDRVMGLLALILFVIPGIWVGLPPSLMFDRDRVLVAFMSWRVVLGVLGLGAVVLLGVGLWWLSDLHLSIRRWLARWQDALRVEIGWRRVLAGSFLLSALSHACLIVAYSAVLRAAHITAEPGAALWLYLVGSLSLLLPISVNGLGLQEGITVALLAGYLVSAADALGVGLILRALMVLFGLLGGLISLGTAYSGRIGRDPARC